MKILYLDCFSGISGDMFLGAMVDAGVDIRVLEDGLDMLGIEGLKLEAGRVRKCGISGTKVDVLASDTTEERHLSDIIEILDNSKLDPDIKKMARAVFRRLAAAESKVHGIPVEHVHFHEVGALDTIADVVGASICLRESGVDAVYASPVNVGGGFVKTSHGLLPVPAPATLEILKGIPIYSSGVNIELATPTGAAILAEVCSGFGHMPGIKVESIGYGAGSKELEMPNMLRAIIGEKTELKKEYCQKH
ncbi:TIGR00299 family protein [Methanocella sp. CWC-04]|uniref:TIGR00299 family protein n=1 Tax=Methanooceanicella nereidis TaxID=2052831 RepID=A0AAP2W4U4_9EURY|nr:nickel pincer cofactor biosynthesis protein LarC [Methanocella sp. CWC-04]MCD1294750.1 TIGR00299 family protein [Methanocella sp. CWC-04]